MYPQSGFGSQPQYGQPIGAGAGGFQDPNFQHQQNYGAVNFHVNTHAKANTPDEDIIERLLLLITWLSIFNCVMKLDYNAAVYLFLYYIWITRTDNRHYKAFMAANGAFIGLDALWFLLNMGSWSSSFSDDTPANYSVWLSFRVYRIFTLIICVVIFFVKLYLLFVQNKVRSQIAQQQVPGYGAVDQLQQNGFNQPAHY